MKEVKERSGGFWRPTAGGIYPILHDLEESRYIEGEWDLQKKRKRKIFRITEAGKAVLKRALAKENQLANSMSDLFEEYLKDVLDVKVNPIQMPRMPNLFSVFLEERKKKPGDTINVLKEKRTQIDCMIEQMQKESEAINKRLAQLERPKKETTPRKS
jgi:DNA-binding PadR family transcriptional regulator